MSITSTETPAACDASQPVRSPTTPAPITQIRSPAMTSASQRPFSAVSMFAVSTARPGGRFGGSVAPPRPGRRSGSDADAGRRRCGRAIRQGRERRGRRRCIRTSPGPGTRHLEWATHRRVLARRNAMLEDQRLGTSTDAAEQSLDDDVLGPGRRQRDGPDPALRPLFDPECTRMVLSPRHPRPFRPPRFLVLDASFPIYGKSMSRNWWCRL